MEPTIGEALCRLFPPDENIDLSRIAKIAKQSLKRPSGGSAGKSAATASRSASSSSLHPPGLSESSSSRSDMLLLALLSDDGRTLRGRGGGGRSAAWTSTSAALGVLCTAVHICGTYLADVLGGSCDCAAKNARACNVMNNPISEWDTESKITVLEAVLRTLKWTFLVNYAGKLYRLTDCKWGGLYERTVLFQVRDVVRVFDQLTCWSEDLPSKIPQRTFLPSWTLLSSCEL